LKNPSLVGPAASSFIAIYFLNVPFPVIVLSAGLIGYLLNSRQTSAGTGAQSAPDLKPQIIANGWTRALKIAAIGLALWFLPLIALGLRRGWDDILVDIGVLFSKAAVVTLGGAYAVLGYIGQQAVGYYGWLLPEQMMDGLGPAETTPGPLIMVNQFVAYVAAYAHTPGLAPALAGAVGGLLATWVTFTPSMLWIFIGAPYIESLRRNVKLASALSAITAAVVGVVLSLGVNFTRHALLPDTGGFDRFALAASVIAFIGMQYRKWPMIPVIIGSATAGLVWKTAL